MGFPLIKVALYFILGIVMAFYTKPSPAVVLLALVFVLLVCVFIHYIYRKKNQGQLFIGMSIFCVSFLVGASSLIIHTDSLRKNHYLHCKEAFEKENFLRLTIRERMKSTATKHRYVAVVSKVGNENVSGKIILNISKDSIYKGYAVGNKLAVKAILYKPKEKNTYGHFNYIKYLENKQIYAQVYANHKSIIVANENPSHLDVLYYADRVRRNIAANLRRSNFGTAEQSVAMALILGQRQDVSPEIMQDYQYAGAIHLLAVSGLHVGIVLIFIIILLKPFPNTRRVNAVRLAIVLLSLFSFAVLAGLAPAVVRAVVMFSFVAIGNYLLRATNIYNSLFASMLVILLFQPYFLFEVGFQLSYIAMLSIVWIQPLLKNLWHSWSLFSRFFWGIISVTIAAQIGVLPISLYYFHQFPTLFFVANLLILPLLSLIMFLGLIIMILASFSQVPWFLLKPFEIGIAYMNKVVNTLASLESFIIKDIPFNVYYLISLYILIITMVIWLKKPSFRKLSLILGSIILFQICLLIVESTTQRKHEFAVLDTGTKSMFVQRTGKNVLLYATDSLQKTAENNIGLKNYMVENSSSIQNKRKIGNVVYFRGRKIYVIDSSSIFPPNIEPEVLILIQSPKINLDRILQQTQPKKVVADGSNYTTHIKRWAISCRKRGIAFHSTREEGAFVILNDEL